MDIRARRSYREEVPVVSSADTIRARVIHSPERENSALSEDFSNESFEDSSLTELNHSVSCSTEYTNNTSDINRFNQTREETSTSSSKALLIIIGCSLIILVGICIGLMPSLSANTQSKCFFEKPRPNNLNLDGRVWNTVSVVIENMRTQRTKTSAVFLFTHQGGRSIRNLIRDIALETANCFENGMELLEMNEEEFSSAKAMEDYGYIVHTFKEKLKYGNVALIVNLNEMPAEVARALHFICDTYTPIVPNAVIFLSLTTSASSDNTVKNARETLVNMWGSTLQNDELDPIISRITDHVIALKN